MANGTARYQYTLIQYSFSDRRMPWPWSKFSSLSTTDSSLWASISKCTDLWIPGSAILYYRVEAWHSVWVLRVWCTWCARRHYRQWVGHVRHILWRGEWDALSSCSIWNNQIKCLAPVWKQDPRAMCQYTREGAKPARRQQYYSYAYLNIAIRSRGVNPPENNNTSHTPLCYTIRHAI